MRLTNFAGFYSRLLMKNVLILLVFFPLLAVGQPKPAHKTPRTSSSPQVPGPSSREPAPTHVPDAENRPPNVTVEESKKQTIDEPPVFKGGPNAWRQFLTRYLDADRVMNGLDSLDLVKYGLQQKVWVQFVVCEDGSLCDYSVANKEAVSQAAADEAIRVMKKSPNWQPAKRNGQQVRTKYRQSIVFMLAVD